MRIVERGQDSTARERARTSPAETARIQWWDPDTGALLWLGLAGSPAFLDELERAGFELQRPGRDAHAERPAGPRAA